MSTVKAEALAVAALRAYLLRTLPAKVATINTERAAVLTAPRAGPYVIPASGSLKVGTDFGSETTEAITAGSRTATQFAAEISSAGITASVDAQDRLVLTSTTAPSGSTKSIVSIGADDTGVNAILGFSPGGQSAVRSALVTPNDLGVSDGQPELIDFESGFWVVIGERTTEAPANIRRDTHTVRMKLEVYAAEPNGSMSGSQEFLNQAVRAVRECLHEDRTLDNAVQLTQLDRVQSSGVTFKFANTSGASPLLSAADLFLAVLVFERS